MKAVEVQRRSVVDAENVDEERGGRGGSAVGVDHLEGYAARRGVRPFTGVVVGDVSKRVAYRVRRRRVHRVEQLLASRERRDDLQRTELWPDGHGETPGPRRLVRRGGRHDVDVHARPRAFGQRYVGRRVRVRRAVRGVPRRVGIGESEELEGRVRGVRDLHHRSYQRCAAFHAREQRVGRQPKRRVALGVRRSQREPARARCGV